MSTLPLQKMSKSYCFDLFAVVVAGMDMLQFLPVDTYEISRRELFLSHWAGESSLCSFVALCLEVEILLDFSSYSPFDFFVGHVCGYIMEHFETRNSGIIVLLVAPYRKQDISRMGLEHISSF